MRNVSRSRIVGKPGDKIEGKPQWRHGRHSPSIVGWKSSASRRAGLRVSSTQQWNDCPSREDGKGEIARPMDRAFGCARNGRRYRMLNESTHECLAIRVARKLKAIDVIDILSDLFILHGHSHSHPLRQRTGVPGQGRAGMNLSCRRQDRLHRAGQSSGERLHRELQRASSR